MTYLLMALVCSVIGVAPLVFMKKTVTAVTMGVLAFFIFWFFFWLGAASIVGPYFGPSLWAILALWIISAVISIHLENRITWIIVFPIVLFILRVIVAPMGSYMFRAQDFASLVGSMDKRVWTQDIQPKDPRHIRLSNTENALYLARNSITRGGNNFGSQFEVAQNSMTLQKINNRFWYVVPLDFKDSYGVWSNTGATPGYIMVSAEEGETEPILKILSEDKRFKYTPNAFFDYNLERHLRMNGYLNVGLMDYTFEIDDEGNPWWIVSTYQPTILNSGEKVTGVVMVNPVTGDSQFYSLDKIPNWVDRAMPKEMIKKYLDWWGDYRKGWINSWWDKLEILNAEEPILVYGSDNTLYWVTGMTSSNNKDTSLVGLTYTNSRDGKSVFYTTNGGSTDSAIMEAVVNNKFVGYMKLHPADPQIYNLYGTMASIMPLLNASHARQGVAIVDVTDIQKVAVGNDLYEALNAYQEMIGSKAKAALEKTRSLEVVNGVVDRIHTEYQGSGMFYRIHLKDIPHLFVGGKNLSRKITVTETGDKVKIEYYASGEEEIPMYKFDNLSITLEGTKTQKEATRVATQRQDEQKTLTDSQTTKERIKNLTPAQLQNLEKHIPTN